MRLKDKVAIVTGSSQGIGAAIARSYQAEGAEVAITYNTQKAKAEQLAKEIGSSLIVHLDVRDRQNIKTAFKQVYDHFGKINILVNNAGINKTADFDKQTDEEWDSVIDVNLTGVFRCCQEILPYITDAGRIINIGSLSGEYGGPRTPSYACAKMGIMLLHIIWPVFWDHVIFVLIRYRRV